MTSRGPKLIAVVLIAVVIVAGLGCWFFARSVIRFSDSRMYNDHVPDRGDQLVLLYLPQQVTTVSVTKSTALMKMMFQVDGSASDWAKFQPIIENQLASSKLGTPGTSLKAVYAVADQQYLYVMIETWGKLDPGNNYVFPVDLNGDGDWDYSFGFNANHAWWYDLRTVPNGRWAQEMALDATYAVGEVAEIAIPLETMGNPTKIDMTVWIYYPSLDTTVDETGWGTAIFTTNSLTTTTAKSEGLVSTLITAASSAATPASFTQASWVQANWEYVTVVIVFLSVVAFLVVRKSRRKEFGAAAVSRDRRKFLKIALSSLLVGAAALLAYDILRMESPSGTSRTSSQTPSR